MDAKAEDIIRAACGGAYISKEDACFLLSFDEYSEEAQAMVSAARTLSIEAASGEGYIFAQIGVDALPCAENCRFCSFAVCNSSQVSAEDAIVPLSEIVAHAQVLDAAGVDIISLMATASLPFEHYLEIVHAVRSAIRVDLPLMANVGDLSLEQAQMLAQAGVDMAYHALRLGEGEITDITPARRGDTFRAIKGANLALMSGVEPLWEGVSHAEVADRIMLQRTLEPFATGVCALTRSDECEMGDFRPASQERVRQVAALVRLVCGRRTPIGCAGGVSWVDAGTDPRSRGYGYTPEILRAQVEKKRHALSEAGWHHEGDLMTLIHDG